jgi:hypothetical protein
MKTMFATIQMRKDAQYGQLDDKGNAAPCLMGTPDDLHLDLLATVNARNNKTHRFCLQNCIKGCTGNSAASLLQATITVPCRNPSPNRMHEQVE